MPEPAAFQEPDQTLLAAADGLAETVREAMDGQEIHRAAEAIWAVVADANRYFAGQEPWALKKTDPARMATVLYATAEVVRQIAILTQPFVPDAAGRLLDLLAVADDARDFSRLGEAGRLAPGAALPKPEPVFPRYVEEAAKEPS